MAFGRSYDSFNSYFKNPYSFNSRSSSGDMSDTILRALQANRDEEEQRLKGRTGLDRVFDLLSTGTYASAGFADGLFNKGSFTTALQQAGQGASAGLAFFGNGNPNHEFTYSKVMENAGWKPESTMGKIARGTVGFVGDVLLDPTTYMTFGVGALAKGVGKVGKIAETVDDFAKTLPGIARENKYNDLLDSGMDAVTARSVADNTLSKYDTRVTNFNKMEIDDAKEVLKFENRKRGFNVTPEQFEKDASQYANKYNKLLGIDRQTKGITFGVENLPFGDKLAPKLGAFGKTINIVDGAKLQKVSDNLRISNGYSALRDSIYGTKIGKLFSNNSKLYDLAKKNPAELYSFVKFLDTTTGQNVDKLASAKAIRERANEMDFTPAESTEIIKLLEDRTIWGKVKDTIKFSETKKAEELNSILKAEIPALDKEVKDLLAHKQHLDESVSNLSKVESERFTHQEDYVKLKDEFRKKVINLDLSHVKDKEELDKISVVMQEEIADIERRIADNETKQMTFKEEANVSKVRKDELNSKMRSLQTREAELRTHIGSLRAPDGKPSIDVSVVAKVDELEAEVKTIQEQLAKVQGDIRATEITTVLPAHQVDTAQWDKLMKLAEEETKFRDAYQQLVTRYGELVRPAEKVEGVDVKNQEDFDFNAGLKEIEKYLNEPDVQEAMNLRFSVPDKIHNEKLINSLSQYIFGVEGRLLSRLEGESLKALVAQVKKGKTPKEIQEFIDLKPQMYSEHLNTVYGFIARELNYKSFVPKGSRAYWEDVYREPMKKLKEKMESEGLTPIEYQKYIKLRDLYIKREEMVVKLFKRMDYDQFKKYWRDHENDAMKRDLERHIDIDTERRRSRFTDDDRASESRKPRERQEKKSNAEIFTQPQRMDVFDDVVLHFLNTMNKRMTKEGKNILPRPAYNKGKERQNIIDTGRLGYITTTTKNAEELLKEHFPNKAYSDLTSGQKTYLLNMSFAKTHGKDVKLPEEVVTAIQQESAKRMSKAKLDAILYTVKEGMEVSWMGDARPRAGKVTKVHATENGTMYDVTVRGETHQIYARDVKSVRTLNKQNMTPEELVKASPMTDELFKQRDELLARLYETESMVDLSKVAQQKETVAGELEQVKAGRADIAESLRTNRKETNQLAKEGEKVISDAEVEKQTRLSALEGHYAEQRRQLLKMYEAKGKSLEIKLADLEVAHINFSKDLNDDMVKAYGVDYEALKKEHAILPDTKVYDDRIDALKAEQGKLKVLLNWDIALQGKLPASKLVSPQTGRLTPEFFTENSRLADALRKAETEKDAFIEANMTYPDAKTMREILGGEETDNHIKALQEELRAKEEAVSNWDALEIYAKTKLDPDYVESALREVNVTQSARISLDDMPYSDKVKKWVKILRAEFDNIGTEEIRIGKLSRAQFNGLLDAYVPHILTPKGKKYIDSLDELEDVKGSLTQDLGYGTVFNQHALSRTITGKGVGEINEYFRDKVKGHNLFSENIQDIYITRALRHNELMFDDQYMRTMMDTFGYRLEPGAEAQKGFKAVVNFGQLKEVVREHVGAYIREATRDGSPATKEVYDKYTQQVLKQFELPPNTLDDFAMPMVELTSKQIEALQEFDIVREVNDAIVSKANQARKAVIKRDQSRMLQTYDKFLHWVKLMQTTVMPSFHLRNKVSNMYLGWLATGRDAFNPKLQMSAMKATWARGDASKLGKLEPIEFTLVDGSKASMTWSEAYDLAKAYGVVDEGFFAVDTISSTPSKGLLNKTSIPDKFDPTDTENFFAFKAGSEVGSRIENSDRLLQFVSHMKQGKSPEQAKELVDKFLFDYSDLTAFEQNVMKRIFPYYTWIRKNGRLQVSQLIDQPEKLALVAKANNAVNASSNEEDRVYDGYLSDFARDWMQLPFSSKTVDENGVEKTRPIMMNSNLPFMDLSRLPDPLHALQTGGGLRDEVLNVASQMAPVPKLTAELASNRNFFFDDDIASEGEGLSPRLAHIARQLAWVNAGEGVVDKTEGDLGRHVLNTLTGVKTLAYDYETSKGMALSDAYDKGNIINDYDKNPAIERLLGKIGSGIITNIEAPLEKEIRKLMPNGAPTPESEAFIEDLKQRVTEGKVSDRERIVYDKFLETFQEEVINENARQNLQRMGIMDENQNVIRE